MSEAATLTTEIALQPTPLAAYLLDAHPALEVQAHAGALVPANFSSVQAEIAAALTSTAVFDLGYRTRIRVTGPDGLRWLNGMVSNAIQSLPEGAGNYNFILNAQGRIQGDAYIYRFADSLLIDTDRSQAARLFAHLDHFIIMDDVELHPLDGVDSRIGSYSIGLAGPKAAATLDALGLPASKLAPLQFVESTLNGLPVTLVHAYGVSLAHYELWLAPENAPAIWHALTGAGAEPIGIAAVESLRVLEGIPLYGVDITERSLAQETSQTRALNFTKGCYLGQEIVERIRSRATIHRSLRQFSLHGEIPAVPANLSAGDDPNSVGQLTSAAKFGLPNFAQALALGVVRVEAAERKQRISYPGGEAVVLESPPVPPAP